MPPMPKSLINRRSLLHRVRPSAQDVEARGFRLELSKRTYVMGVLNVTPDSFSDGGLFLDADRAVQHGIEMAREGAGIIDIGGESTRPGAADVTEAEEIDRVVPVIERLAKAVHIPISVDTRKSKVAIEALKAGASIVNDVSGLAHDPAMAPAAAKYGASLIIMHTRGTPKTMQSHAVYKDLMRELIAELRASIKMAAAAGVDKAKIIIDPGVGFGKMTEHNLQILNRLEELKALGRPICIGTSRKSFIGKVLGIESPLERLSGTLATCTIAVMKGARILRVHDVKDVAQAARMTDSVLKEEVA